MIGDAQCPINKQHKYGSGLPGGYCRKLQSQVKGRGTCHLTNGSNDQQDEKRQEATKSIFVVG